MDWQTRKRKRVRVDREGDREMESGYMQEQHGQELQEIEMNGKKRATSYTR